MHHLVSLLQPQAATRKERVTAGTQLPNGIAPAELPQERGVEDLITEHLLGNMSIISEAELVCRAPHPAAPAWSPCSVAEKPVYLPFCKYYKELGCQALAARHRSMRSVCCLDAAALAV
jgi:hypothetical protein